jgi:hypothetical protein
MKGGSIMKKMPLFIIVLVFLTFSLSGGVYGWQGRMAGMGDPYGLMKDESDFLIHPADIAKGQEINFYGNYRYNYTKVMDWNHSRNYLTPIGNDYNPIQNSGHEWDQSGLLGTAFPLGPGRMGLFFEYAGKGGDFKGENNEFFDPDYYPHSFNFKNDLDSFAIRLLYGLPIGSFKLGGEFQLAYRTEENKTFIDEDLGWQYYWNSPLGNYFQWINLHQFLFPFDANYWEGILKGSLKGAIGPVKIAFTLRGGWIFWGDNKYEASSMGSYGPAYIDGEGDVKGWNVGGDLWVRYPLNKDLSLPFLFKINYQDKTRDASRCCVGIGDIYGLGNGGSGDYENREKHFQIEVGGGVDKGFTTGTRIAAGIYYNYLQNKYSFKGVAIDDTGLSQIVNHSNYPDQTENRIILKVAGEQGISPMFSVRMGLDFFYGWMKEDFNFNFSDSTGYSYVDNISLNGSRWGIGASLGGTVKFNRLSFEPFISGGYQKLKLNGDGYETSYPSFDSSDKLKKEWFIGGGLSVRF